MKTWKTGVAVGCAVVAAAVVLGVAGWAVVRAADAPAERTLPSGLRVRTVPIAGAKDVVVVLGTRAGFFEEPAGSPHLAHVAEHLVVFGSPAASDEGQAVDRWFRAGKVNGETLPGFMYFDIGASPADLDLALRIQAARLARPEFAEATLAREVPRALGELEFLEKSETGSTAKFATSAFVQAAVHGRTEVPIRAATRAFTVDDVRRFHARTFRPDRATLVVVGGFDPATVRQSIDAAFGAIPPAPEKPAALLPPPPSAGRRTARWDVSARHLFLAWPVPPALSPEHPALTVVASILVPRIMTDPAVLKLAKMPLVSNEVEGFFLVNAELKPGADADALRALVLGHVERLSRPEGLSDAQADQARRALSDAMNPSPFRLLALSLGGSPVMARTNVELQRLSRSLVWGDLAPYLKRLDAVDGPTVRAVAGRLLTPGRVVDVRIEPMPK